MYPHPIYYQLAVVEPLWFCVMLRYIWSRRGAVAPPPVAEPIPPQYKRKRSNAPQPFEGLTQRPDVAILYRTHGDKSNRHP